MSWEIEMGEGTSLKGHLLYFAACGFSYHEAVVAGRALLSAAHELIDEGRGFMLPVDLSEFRDSDSWIAVPLSSIEEKLKESQSQHPLDRRDVGIAACALASDPDCKSAVGLADVRCDTTRATPCLLLNGQG